MSSSHDCVPNLWSGVVEKITFAPRLEIMQISYLQYIAGKDDKGVGVNSKIVDRMKNTNKRDLSGKWFIHENFEHGTSTGLIDIIQIGTRFQGDMRSVEQIAGEETILVEQKIKGFIKDDMVHFKSIEAVIPYIDGDIQYELDSWKGEFDVDGSINGRSQDEEGVDGFFSMERIDLNSEENPHKNFFGLN